jgi:hypothetical protein
MSAFDGLICKCGHKITMDDIQWSLESNTGDSYPIYSDDGFWEYFYVCPDCGKSYLRPIIGDDYSPGS